MFVVTLGGQATRPSRTGGAVHQTHCACLPALRLQAALELREVLLRSGLIAAR
ncbi:hypothetical protein SAMN05216456_0733 [Devosia crocina]|uniref:Uncharacterized protein n=1 Tax=Devosia crocina TaxID=429728 RepID=A0A1I7N3X7_9HYPH|nr:hypothetical protein [Devosia crocina]SFV29352.1 hypothetical protein SAMN05216456_0733 [Devosia crocina]